MITKLKAEEILKILEESPEQVLFDWKRELNWEKGDEAKKAELLKDITAIANGTTSRDGFIFYGVDPRQPDPIIGLSKEFDDGIFQQFVTGKVDPAVIFIFYTVEIQSKKVGVIHIPPSRFKPHIITLDIGSLRDGQIPVRRGSSTGGIRRSELKILFVSESGKPSQEGLITALHETIRLISNEYHETKHWAGMAGDTMLTKWQIKSVSFELLPPNPSIHEEVNSLIVKARGWSNAWSSYSDQFPVLEFYQQENVLRRIGACLLSALLLERKLDGIPALDGLNENSYFNGYRHHDIGDQSPWIS